MRIVFHAIHCYRDWPALLNSKNADITIFKPLFKHIFPTTEIFVNKINYHSFINGVRVKKAQNEKFIFSHVEVIYFYAVRTQKRKPKINSGASWMYVIWHGKYWFSWIYVLCIFIVCLCHSSVKWSFHSKHFPFDLNKYEFSNIYDFPCRVYDVMHSFKS